MKIFDSSGNQCIYFLDDNRSCSCIEVDKLSPDLIGHKAYGLLALPSKWTPPFFVISHVLISEMSKQYILGDTYNIEAWIKEVAHAVCILKMQGDLIIRSSSVNEGISERGRYHSIVSNLEMLSDKFYELFNKLKEDSDIDISSERIPLIVQLYVDKADYFGHLSNERHLKKDKRDWLYYLTRPTSDIPIEQKSINIRNWRKSLLMQDYDNECLSFKGGDHDSALYVICYWASKSRIHFEFVIKENVIYVVQADVVKEFFCDDNPINSYNKRVTSDKSNCDLKCLSAASENDYEIYKKIHNIGIYRKLNLPTAEIYVLKACLVEPHADYLLDDIKCLLRIGSIVVRLDIVSDDRSARQMLPRASFNDASKAVAWIQENVEIFSDHLDLVLLFHNFIPSLSSAFAHASPGERMVQIESLWGVPEGLYYYAHDKYVVDTGFASIVPDYFDLFDITKKINYKGRFVTPNDNEEWIARKLFNPFDWKESIPDDSLIKKIALYSRRIVELEQKSLSVMWFVEVDKEVSQDRLLAFHHEEYNDIELKDAKEKSVRNIKGHTDYIIRTSLCITKLESETGSNISSIRIQPEEPELLRNKDTLKRIGEIAQRLDATIQMEGSILSHAFYQLKQTGAHVEVVLPSIEHDYRMEFNKLVRDKIPEKIKKGGEMVKIASLSGTDLIKALKDKLVEEAYEVFDATNEEELIAELVDVIDVAEEIKKQIKVSQEDFESVRIKKNDKVGGFSKGLVLMETSNLLPDQKVRDEQDLLGDLVSDLEDIVISVSYDEMGSKRVRRNNDRKIVNDKINASVTNVSVPVVKKEWVAEMPSIDFVDASGVKGGLSIKVSSLRSGSVIKLNILVTLEDENQLSLF